MSRGVERSTALWSHDCEHCNLNVTVEGVITKDLSSKDKRGSAKAQIKSQVPWEILCANCDQFWNRIIERLTSAS